MRSRLPKVLHPLAGRPMLQHVLASLAEAGIEQQVVVVGHDAEQVEAAVGGGATTTVRQEPQKGTADAVRIGLELLDSGTQQVVVAMGDAPLVPAAVFEELLSAQAAGDACIALLASRPSDPSGYGRLVRDAGGSLQAIVEEDDADAAVLELGEVNAGTYCFDAGWLRANIGAVPVSPSGEHYLTDLVEIAISGGSRVVVVSSPRAELAMGINDRSGLAAAERILRGEIAERHMRNGVTIVDPSSTFIDIDVQIGEDARIEPWTVLSGATRIGSDAVIGPQAQILDSKIGARTTVWSSVVESSVVGEDVEIGPYSHLRPGCEIGPGCRIGNFTELKKTRIGAGSQIHHFSYLGDADVGEAVNIGAGTITANFDGTAKHRTTIGDRAFIGVDTMLRAPVSIGPGARTGAGAVVTRDVPAGETVVGMPARRIGTRQRKAPDRNPEQGGGKPRSDA
ncbi:MAG: bifunctional UDP-N-acetylglucosamine diphosphorylase/glucosamine-1-phosphate N-acetyltransferase GlmU [Chloroflexi bacterium]|nr:bifunctional UDP-N-acetylglucosamine diphosphorylase/glucosamine-1-phosphate N-acetyltransferase GlmU [Chloroflexota bacterium]